MVVAMVVEEVRKLSSLLPHLAVVKGASEAKQLVAAVVEGGVETG